MKTIFRFQLLMIGISVLLVACGQTTIAITPTSLPTKTLTPIPTLTNMPTLTPTATFTPSPTPTPQILEQIFPDGFHSQSVWSNAGGNASRNYLDEGWHCPAPDLSSTNCGGAVIHFDVSVPNDFTRNDFVLSPVNGKVYNIYDVGEGKSIQIMPEPGFGGIAELLKNEDRISTLAKGIFKFSYDINDVAYVALHLAHVMPIVEIGTELKAGDPVGTVYWDNQWNPKKVAYVIYVHMKDGTEWQFSPCDVPNKDEFCRKCTPGTIYPCP